MNDITALMATMKAAAISAKELGAIARYSKGRAAIEAFIGLATPDNVKTLVEALEKSQAINAAAEKLVRCKGRYHSEQNYRALAALFGVKAPDLPPMGGEAHTVKLPKLYGIDFCDRIVPDSGNGFLFYSEQVVEILAAAGIQVIEGEG